MPEPYEPVGMAVFTVDGQDAGTVHVSVLAAAARLAGRLGGRTATALGALPVRFAGEEMTPLRRDLREVLAFADVSRRTGWTLGPLAAAPEDRQVPVLDTPEGRVWAHPVRGFELHQAGAAHRITELAGLPGGAQRVAFTQLLGPLADAAGRAGELRISQLADAG